MFAQLSHFRGINRGLALEMKKLVATNAPREFNKLERMSFSHSTNTNLQGKIMTVNNQPYKTNTNLDSGNFHY